MTSVGGVERCYRREQSQTQCCWRLSLLLAAAKIAAAPSLKITSQGRAALASGSGSPHAPPSLRGATSSRAGWHLVWEDEFAGNSIDNASWNVWTGAPGSEGLEPGGNVSRLNDAWPSESSVSVKGGALTIRSNRQRAAHGYNYTSGGTFTLGKRSWGT